MVTKSRKVVNICQELVLGKVCYRGDCFKSMVKGSGVLGRKVWGEEISKCVGNSRNTVLLARKQYTVFIGF